MVYIMLTRVGKFINLQIKYVSLVLIQKFVSKYGAIDTILFAYCNNWHHMQFLKHHFDSYFNLPLNLFIYSFFK